MSQENIHRTKYEGFKKDAENKDNTIPTRINSYFNATFHVIEMVAARYRVHVNKHGMLRRVLETNPDLFGENTEAVWRKFQELESRIRPGQIYGSSINGEKLKQTKEIFEFIEKLSLEE